MNNISPDFPEIDRVRALAALKEAESFVQNVRTGAGVETLTVMQRIEEEARRIQQANAALMLAFLADERCPASMLKPWASVQQIRKWRDDPEVQLDVVIKHGRCCIRPSAFFAHWRTLAK